MLAMKSWDSETVRLNNKKKRWAKEQTRENWEEKRRLKSLGHKEECLWDADSVSQSVKHGGGEVMVWLLRGVQVGDL